MPPTHNLLLHELVLQRARLESQNLTMDDAKMPDLYAVLGIPNQNASQQEIRVTYEKLSLKFPSDGRVGRVPSDAVELIKVGASLG